MSKTITGVMPIRTVGLTPGHRWCGGLRSVKPAVNNGKGARGLVQGPNSLNASYTHPGRISGRPRKLARDLRNRHLALLSRTFTFELAPTRSPSISVEYDYVDKQSIPTAGLSPASPTALWAAGHRISPSGHEQPIATLGDGLEGHREDSLDGPGLAGEGQLADDGVVAGPVEGHLTAGQQQPQRDRQIEAVGVLLEIGRSEVDDGPVHRATISRIDDGALDTVRALLDGGLCQSDQDGLGHR